MSSEKDIGEWLLKELYYSFIDARKHKRHTRDEHIFELNVMENLYILKEDILYHRYHPSRGVAFIVHEPVVREIFAAPFRDRVVHHFLFRQSAGWWDRRLLYDSYSCRPGKGTLFGIRRLQQHMRQVSKQGTEDAYVLKFDLQGYFMSLPKQKIYERVCWGLDRQFDESKLWLKDLLRYLWREIIFDEPTKNVNMRGSINDWDDLPDNKSLFCGTPGKGVVIGNLSSQLLSNIYLDQLDRYITFGLEYKHYGRYVDDFFIVVTKDKLSSALNDIVKINDYLRELELVLHPNKRYVQNIKRGIPFLGAVVYLDSVVASKRIKRNFYRALHNYSMELVDDSTIISYLGYLKNIDGKKLAKKFFDDFSFDYYF